MKRITLGILVITMIAAAAVAAPHGGRGPGGGPPEPPPGILADFLDEPGDDAVASGGVEA